MEMLIYIIVSLLLAVAPLAVRSERATHILAGLFFGVQVVAIALLLVFGRVDSVVPHTYDCGVGLHARSLVVVPKG